MDQSWRAFVADVGVLLVWAVALGALVGLAAAVVTDSPRPASRQAPVLRRVPPDCTAAAWASGRIVTCRERAA